jgi:hypothetical protein
MRIVYTVNVKHVLVGSAAMVKIVNLPDVVYEDLVSVSNELTSMAGKPISLAMAVYLMTAVYHAHLREPCARDAFRQRLSSLEILSPEEFEKARDEAPSKARKKREK